VRELKAGPQLPSGILVAPAGLVDELYTLVSP
jgi:hypothetical protein